MHSRDTPSESLMTATYPWASLPCIIRCCMCSRQPPGFGVLGHHNGQQQRQQWEKTTLFASGKCLLSPRAQLCRQPALHHPGATVQFPSRQPFTCLFLPQLPMLGGTPLGILAWRVNGPHPNHTVASLACLSDLGGFFSLFKAREN